MFLKKFNFLNWLFALQPFYTNEQISKGENLAFSTHKSSYSSNFVLNKLYQIVKRLGAGNYKIIAHEREQNIEIVKERNRDRVKGYRRVTEYTDREE